MRPLYPALHTTQCGLAPVLAVMQLTLESMFAGTVGPSDRLCDVLRDGEGETAPCLHAAYASFPLPPPFRQRCSLA